MTRNQFLQRFSMFFFGTVGATSLLTSCSSKEQAESETATAQPEMKEAAAEDPCNDLTGLTDVEINVRKTFEYVGKSTNPEQVCDNCQFWVVPEAGSACGGCQIMKGPFNPKGYCTQWTAKVA